jgi:predicted HTH transcriptional regulator
MTNELFESLLFEEEGTTIDFKKEQYRFANAWRRTKAYILIGVEEVRGDKSKVVGIPASEQLDDHSLQQFINSLVNTPVHFQYRAFSYQGKQIGIFVLDEGQQRPIYLKRSYGKLEKDRVYVDKPDEACVA